MLGQRFCKMAMMIRRPSRLLCVLGVAWAVAVLTLLGLGPRVTVAQALNGTPTVEKLTIAVESWGFDSLNPVRTKSVNFLWANFLPFEDHQRQDPWRLEHWDDVKRTKLLAETKTSSSASVVHPAL